MAVQRRAKIMVRQKAKKISGPKLNQSIRIYKALRAAGVPEAKAQELKRAAYYMKPSDFVNIISEERRRGVDALAKRSKQVQAAKRRAAQRQLPHVVGKTARRTVRRRRAA